MVDEREKYMLEERKSLIDRNNEDREVYGMVSDKYYKTLLNVINSEKFYKKRFSLLRFIFKNKIIRNCFYILTAVLIVAILMFLKQNLTYVYIVISFLFVFYTVKFILKIALFDKKEVCSCKSKIRKRLKG